MPKTLSVSTEKGVAEEGKAQAAEANKPKKSVRFYPVVQCIYYDRLGATSGGLLRVEVVPWGEGRRFSLKNIR